MVESINKLSLRKDLEIRGGYRDEKGKPIWQIYDPVKENFYAFSESEYEVIRRLGNAGKDKVLNALERLGFTNPEELLRRTVTYLYNNFLLNPVPGLTAKTVSETKKKLNSGWLPKLLYSYIFFKIPICNPDGFFKDFQPLASAVFNKWTRFFLYIFAVTGFAQIFFFQNEYSKTFSDLLHWHSVIPVLLVMFFIKVFHELSHGFTARHFGCKVKSTGLAFILFMPRFYTDISDSWKLTDNIKRVKIDAAGILFELVIGGICAFIWAWTYGALSTICFYIFTVSTLNTLFVNGNPLMKFDGYYALMDVTNIRNLRERGKTVLRKIFHRLILGHKTNLKGNWSNCFIGLYGILSFLYKILIYTSIIIFIYHSFSKELALLLIVLEFSLLVLFPFYRESKLLIKAAGNKYRFSISILVIAFLISLLFIPFEQTISVPCEFKPESSISVYTKGKGYISQIHNGGTVGKNTPLLLMVNKNLTENTELFTLDKKLLTEEHKNTGQTPEELLKRKLIENKIEGINKKIEASRKRQSALKVSSPASGTFFPNRMLKKGLWCNPGTNVGEVVSTESLKASLWVEENNLEYFSEGTAVTIFIDQDQIAGSLSRPTLIPVNEAAASPLLTSNSGDIEFYSKNNNKLYLKTTHYIFNSIIKYKELLIYRTGKAQVTFKGSIFENLKKKIMGWL